jgi:hypothetical protein
MNGRDKTKIEPHSQPVLKHGPSTAYGEQRP